MECCRDGFTSWIGPASPGARKQVLSGEALAYLRQSIGEQIEDDAHSGCPAGARMRDQPQPGGHLRNRREHLTDRGNCVGQNQEAAALAGIGLAPLP